MIHPQHRQELLDSAIDEEVISLNFRSLEGLAAYYHLLYSDKLQRTNTGVLARGILNTYAFLDDGGWWCSGVDPRSSCKPMPWGCFKPNKPRANFETGKAIKYEHPPKEETRAFFLRVTWEIGFKVATLAGKREEYEQRFLEAAHPRAKEAGKEETEAAAEARAESFEDESKTSSDGNKVRVSFRCGMGQVLCETRARDTEPNTQRNDGGIEGVSANCLSQEDCGFWQWVANTPEIPLVKAEGAKKAGCFLSQGFAAVGLPSHTGGYRNALNEFGEKTRDRYLIPDLKPFATPGREIYICFDHDEKQKTVRLVNKSTSTFGYLLEQSGCKVKVIKWDEPYKGVDDFIAALGAEAFKSVYDSALTLDNWNTLQYNQLTYPASVELNQRYLGKLSIPDDVDLVCIKSPKGTGKTESLISEVGNAIASGQPVLVIGHRIQLVQELCRRFGLPYITEVRQSSGSALLGYGLCGDSLHPQSQARFIAAQWSEALIIIDEAEQVVWHLLNSNTCTKNRGQILASLRELLTNVANSHTGRIVLADADLSDLSIDYVRGLANALDLKQWTCINNWKPETGWDVTVNHSLNMKNEEYKQPGSLIESLDAHIRSGGKPFIVCSGQRVTSSWGTIILEEYYRRNFPDKKILRIDSESISEPGHPAYGCITKLNEIVLQYDIVIASPSIETGVSIDIKGHFTSVWGIFQGVTPSNSALQALARLREPVPRHIWARNYSSTKIGNGGTSYKSVLASQHKVAKNNIALLQDALKDIETNSDPLALTTWAKMAARINADARNYKRNIVDALIAEGHRVNICNSSATDAIDTIKAEIKDCRESLHQAECEAIVASEDISDVEYKLLKDKKAKTPVERRVERKYELKQRYTEKIDIDVDLIKKDDLGWYPQIRLHYFLTLGRQHLQVRDLRKAEFATSYSPNVWIPDFNKAQLSTPVTALEKLGVLEFANPNVEISSNDERVIAFAETIKSNRWQIKAATGVGVSDKDTPIAIVQRFLKKVGLKLTCTGRRGSRDDRQRNYKYVDPADGRNQIFEAWLERDEAVAAELVSTLQAKENSVSTLTNRSIDIKIVDTNPDTTRVETEKEAPMLVACKRFGQRVKFIVEDFIGETQALISSLTGELFTVPVDELEAWSGA